MVSIQETGSGSPLVLFHGAPGSVKSFDPVVERFSPRFRVMVPAWPGYAPSPRLQPYSLDGALRQVEDALLARGVTEAAVVGFSIGAYRALSMALSGRVRVTRMVLLGGFADFTADDRANAAGFANFVELLPELTSPFWRNLLYARFLSSRYLTKHPESKALIDEWLLSTNASVLVDELRGLAGLADLTPRLGELRMPIVARVGEHDLASPVAYSQHIVSHVPDGTLEVVPDAGHALLIEDKNETLASIARVLAGPADKGQ